MKVLLIVGLCLVASAMAKPKTKQGQGIPEINPPPCSSGAGTASQHRMWAQDQFPDLPGYQGVAGETYLCVVEFTPSENCSASTEFRMTARPLDESALQEPFFTQIEELGEPLCAPNVLNDAVMHFNIPADAPKGDVLYTFEVWDGDNSILCLQGVGEII